MKRILDCFRNTPFFFSAALAAALIIHGLFFICSSGNGSEKRVLTMVKPMRIGLRYISPEKPDESSSHKTPHNDSGTLRKQTGKEAVNAETTTDSQLPSFLKSSGEDVAELNPSEQSGPQRVDFNTRFSGLQTRGLLPAPGYPEQARLSGWEGRVIVDITISRKGQISDVSLVESSGYSLLDDLCIRTVKTSWEFPPQENTVVTQKVFVFILE